MRGSRQTRLALAVAGLALACGRDAAAAGCRSAPRRTSAAFAAPGPQAVGIRTLTVVDATRPTPPNRGLPGAATRTLVTEVWYPALAPGRDTPLDARGAPHPLVIHAHALLDSRTGEYYLAAHLASHGYVVAAPDFPLSRAGAPGGPTLDDVAAQPGDLRAVLDHLLVLAAEPTSPLAGAVDAERVGLSGLSLGATTALLATYHAGLRDPRVRAVAAMAPPFSCALGRRFFRIAAVPLLLLQGTNDLLVPAGENSRRAFARARGPRTLVLVRDGSHLGFIGFANGLDPSRHYDALGCSGLLAVAGPTPTLPLPGGPHTGIAADLGRVCTPPCRRSAPGPALVAARQHELARLATTAFLDAHLGGDEGAACFLRRGLARENRELRVLSRTP
jgi:predicted dienelactone hydrolase